MDIITIQDCCICYEPVDKNKAACMQTCCKHKIHKICFVKWLVTKIENPSCPVCGTHLNRDNINTILPKEMFIKYASKIINDKSKYLAAIIYEVEPPSQSQDRVWYKKLLKHTFICIVLFLVIVVMISWTLHKN